MDAQPRFNRDSLSILAKKKLQEIPSCSDRDAWSHQLMALKYGTAPETAA